MAPKATPEIRVDEFNELKSEVADIKESVTQIQLGFMKNLSDMNGSIKSIESMMKSGFAFGKEECFNHRQNIAKEQDRLNKAIDNHAARIGELEKKNAGNQVISSIITGVITAVLVFLATKFIP